MSFARKFGDKYGKKLMYTAPKVGTNKYGKNRIDTTKKQGSEFAKTAGKRIVKKSAESTDLIENKIADKITSLSKSKNKEKERVKKKKLLFHQKKDKKSIIT